MQRNANARSLLRWAAQKNVTRYTCAQLVEQYVGSAQREYASTLTTRRHEETSADTKTEATPSSASLTTSSKHTQQSLQQRDSSSSSSSSSQSLPRLSNLSRQKALFPGAASTVRAFDGDYRYQHSKHSHQMLVDSVAYISLPFLVGVPAVLWYTAVIAGPVLAAPWWALYGGICAAGLRLFTRGRGPPVPQKDLRGRVVLVLGGTGAMGRHVAARCAKMGATIVVAGRVDPAKEEAAAKFFAKACGGDSFDIVRSTTKTPTANPPSEDANESAKEGGAPLPSRIVFRPLDLNYLGSLRDYARLFEKEFEHLDIIVNASGVMFAEQRLNRFFEDEQLSTNALGPVVLVEYLMPLLTQSAGRVVHVTSNAIAATNDNVLATYLQNRQGLWGEGAEERKKQSMLGTGGGGAAGASQTKNSPAAARVIPTSTKGGDLMAALSAAHREGTQREKTTAQTQLQRLTSSIRNRSGNSEDEPKSSTGRTSDATTTKKDKFDGLEQYGFTKLCVLFHAQYLAARSYRTAKSATSSNSSALSGAGEIRRPAEGSVRFQGGAAKTVPSSASSSEQADSIPPLVSSAPPAYTAVSVTPGGVLTPLFRHTPQYRLMRWLSPLLYCFMRTPQEGADQILSACLRDDVVNGGYYQDGRYMPEGLPAVACSVEEREKVMQWIRQRTRLMVEGQQQQKGSQSSTARQR